jgi:hypothetical protein
MENFRPNIHQNHTRRLHSVKYIVELISALPGNGSVNTVQHGTVDEAVFSMSSVPLPALLTGQ